MRGLDYSAGKPGGAAIQRAGFDFVVRYLAYPNARPKYITRAEAQDLLAHGIGIALVWETTAGRALAGRQAGAADARTAASSAAAVGQPADRPIYFAVDQDVTTSGQMAAVDAYLDGAAGVVGRGRVGVYGEHDVVEHCLSTGRARFGWQTMAWSRGRRSDRAHLIQELGWVTVGGIQCDENTAKREDFGQWPAPVAAESKPTPASDAQTQQEDQDVRLYQADGDDAVYAGAPGAWWHVPTPEMLGTLAGPGGAEVVRVNARQRDLLRQAYLAMRPQPASVDVTGLAAALAAALPRTAEAITEDVIERAVRTVLVEGVGGTA